MKLIQKTSVILKIIFSHLNYRLHKTIEILFELKLFNVKTDGITPGERFLLSEKY